MSNIVNGLKIENDTLQKSKQPFQCPNCQGGGNKHKTNLTGYSNSTIEFVKCHSCSGTGILWK